MHSLRLHLCHIKGSTFLCLRLRRNENQALNSETQQKTPKGMNKTKLPDLLNIPLIINPNFENIFVSWKTTEKFGNLENFCPSFKKMLISKFGGHRFEPVQIDSEL